jgi:hypothetical protein
LDFCASHAVLASLAFAVSMPPLHWDIYPLIIVMVDYPASLLAGRLSDLANGNQAIDCLIYVIIGSIWFYLIGFLLRIIIKNLKSEKTTQ